MPASIPNNNTSKLLRALLMCMCLVITAYASAAPFEPSTDDTVLFTLPSAELAGRKRISTLHEALANSPGHHETRAEIGAVYVGLYKDTGDPRYLGYLEALLRSTPLTHDIPVRLEMLAAHLAQASHDFELALSILDRIHAREPRLAQAWLMRAAIAEVIGDYEQVRGACARLVLAGAAVPGKVCAASLSSLSGNSETGYRLITEVLAAADSLEPATAAWAYSIAGEIARRLDEIQAAENHLRQALQYEHTIYNAIALADLLIDTGRPDAALAMLRDQPTADGVLLRRAMAQRRLDKRDALATAQVVAERVADSRRADDRHARERAIYELHLGDDPKAALAAAQINWRHQKQTLDARLLLASAIAANAADAAAPVLDWMDQNNSDDRELLRMRSRLLR